MPAAGFNGYASNGFTATYATDQMTGALPAGISVLEEASCLDYGQPEQLPFGDEGRALLQIVHAVAPGAGLAFHTAVNSEADFASGIVALAQAGAKIIDDDIGYPDEPFFQDGVVAQAIDQVGRPAWPISPRPATMRAYRMKTQRRRFRWRRRAAPTPANCC